MTVDVAPQTDKEIVLEMLRRMPECATLQEISEELAILAAIRQGEVAAEAGKVVSHEEVVRRSATWMARAYGVR